MKIWPTISHKTLDKCNKGAFVRTTIPKLPPLGIVCDDTGGSRGLIFLGDNCAIYHPIVKPSSYEVFQYGCDTVLLLDQDSSDTSSQLDMRSTMGLVVFFKSGCYINVHHHYNPGQHELQFNFDTKIIHFATHRPGDDKGLAFKRWGLTLVNPYISNTNPVEIFNMSIE